MRTINELVELMATPADPLDVPTSEDWERCESELAVLPDDYKDFIRAYGSGAVDDFLWVFNPATDNEHLNLASQAKLVLAALEESSRTFPDVFSMPRFPATDGFLPFASTDNGDNIFWVTSSDNPNEWTIAVMGPRSPEVFEYPSGWIDFLVAMIQGEVRCHVFPPDFPDAPPISFTSTRG